MLVDNMYAVMKEDIPLGNTTALMVGWMEAIDIRTDIINVNLTRCTTYTDMNAIFTATVHHTLGIGYTSS
jgi:hypothetical protein